VKSKYLAEIQSMMYTCGDVRNVLSETAELVEDIVHGQIVELVKHASQFSFMSLVDFEGGLFGPTTRL
jgi:hypothetical protein